MNYPALIQRFPVKAKESTPDGLAFSNMNRPITAPKRLVKKPLTRLMNEMNKLH